MARLLRSLDPFYLLSINQPQRPLKNLLPGVALLAALIWAAGFAACRVDGRPSIYFAAKRGETNKIASYIARGANLNGLIISHPSGQLSEPLLHTAAKFGQLGIAELLLTNGASPNALDSVGNSPLMPAIGRDPDPEGMKILELLLRQGADLNRRGGLSGGGWTPLAWAALLGREEAVRILLRHGADVNLPNLEGQTPLHVAKTPEIAQLLIDKGASLDQRSIRGFLPSESALRAGRTNVARFLRTYETTRKN